jgi:ATP:ADP antiporter, AAA family
MLRGTPHSPLVRQALVSAALMMAWQVAGKTTRDSLFLTAFPATALPAMMGGAAIAAILMAILNAALLRRVGPSRVIPFGYLAGMVLHAAEWVLLPRFPHVVAVTVYLHVVALGSVLLSGFWALANEQFDPREARHHFGRIAAFGTLGTIAGGLMAERVASLASPRGLLLLLGALQLACALALFRFAPAKAERKDVEDVSFPEVISGARYLLGLAGLVMLAAMSASSLDFLFKAQAVTQFGRGAPLSRFFSLFYTATSAITFAVQVGGSRMWMKRFGPGRTVAILPVAVTGVSLAAIFAPGVIALTIGRAIELLLRGSLYRSGYELFYTPMPEAEKRSVKSVIDIGAERLGDGLAGASIQLLLALPAQALSTAILGFTATIAALGVWLALRLDRVYVEVLERGLAHQDNSMGPEQTGDETGQSRSIVMNSAILEGVSFAPQSVPPALLERGPDVPLDPALRNLWELRSGDTVRIAAALRRIDAIASVEVPQVIELLDRDEVAQLAYLTLRRSGDRIAGQLVDALRDPESTYNVRKRVPKVMASCESRIAWDGLTAHLLDERFEVRTRCARAMDRILARRPEYRPDPESMFEVVRQELATTRRFSKKGWSEQGVEMEKALKDRTAKSIEHIFTLLGLVLPRQSVRQAFRALHAQDRKLSGVALEYLDSILPRSLREELTAHFEGLLDVTEGAITEQEVAELVDANPSMMHRLEYWVDPVSPSKTNPSKKDAH